MLWRNQTAYHSWLQMSHFMHNSEPTVKRQNDLLLGYRKAECECPLYLFVLTLWSVVTTSTHVIGYFLFGTPAPASTCVPTAIPSRRPWGCLLSGNSSLASSTGCLGDLFRISLLNLCPPLFHSQLCSKTSKVWVPTCLHGTGQAYSCSLPCFEWCSIGPSLGPV